MKCGSNLARVAAVVLFCLALAATGCMRSAPILNINNAPVPAGKDAAKPMPLDQMATAIQAAGAGLGWMCAVESPGHIVATLNVRSHQAVVDIVYDAKVYNINYKTSTNLNAGNGKIHSNYNGWVENLNKAIQQELTRAAGEK